MRTSIHTLLVMACLSRWKNYSKHADEAKGPTVVLGDFNTLSKTEAGRHAFRYSESHGYSTPFTTGIPTWRTTFLRMHADWIFVRDLEVLRWGVARPLNVFRSLAGLGGGNIAIADCRLPISSADSANSL